MTPKRAIIWAAVSTRPQAEEDEKFSIPVQIAEAEAVCAERGWQIIDRLIVPGHSRNYRDLNTLAKDARAEGIDAFDRLIAHFERRDFDIIVCRDANRFARRSSLLHLIVEIVTEDCRASIYSLQDRYLIDENNADMWATMKGYASRAEVKWLVKATREGLKQRVARGLTTTKIPFSHKLVRDERLKPIKVVVDETKRRLFNDIFTLIVDERHPFEGIEKTLYERFGHVADDGKPYGDNIVYSFLYHPLTWGATTYGNNRKPNGKKGYGRNYGIWTFDETYEPPPHVTIYRGVVEPVYVGERAEQMKAELRRRKEMLGRRRPRETNMFSGIFVCGECGWSLTNVGNRLRSGARSMYGMRCNSPRRVSQWAPKCSQTGTVRIDYLRNYINSLLLQMLAEDDISYVIGEKVDNSVDALEAELNAMRVQIDNLIRLQLQAHPTAQAAYQRQIDTTAQQIDNLTKLYDAAIVRNRSRVQREREAHEALQTIGNVMNRFWQLPQAEINQLLHRLLGERRFVVYNGKIVGMALNARARQQRRR